MLGAKHTIDADKAFVCSDIVWCSSIICVIERIVQVHNLATSTKELDRVYIVPAVICCNFPDFRVTRLKENSFIVVVIEVFVLE